MHILRSTSLSFVKYDKETEELVVTFHSGRSYTYESVPKEVYDGLLKAESAGLYYAQRIKGVYG